MKRLNGIRLPRLKHAEDQQVVSIPLPEIVRIPMLMHAGVPCRPAVEAGAQVLVGQVIGVADKNQAVPIHASVSGTVTAVSQYHATDGSKVPCIEIEADGEQFLSDDCQPPTLESQADLVHAARVSGCVGLGGDGSLTYEKLDPPEKPHILIVNGAECEPYLTVDSRLMTESADDIVGGIALIMKLLRIKEARIGITADKTAAIKLLTDACAAQKGISVCPLPPLYPQGAEKVLIFHTCGIVIPENQTAADCGVLVLNVSTCAFLYQYSQTGIPLVSRVVTVDGDAVRKPCNLRVPVGTPVHALLEYAGCDFKAVKQLIAGGPMMGVHLRSFETPVLRQQNGLLALTKYQKKKESACMRCGCCMHACPMHLMPMELNRAYQKKDVNMLQSYRVSLCMNCGCCSYVCPAARPLAETNQLAKALLQQL